MQETASSLAAYPLNPSRPWRKPDTISEFLCGKCSSPLSRFLRFKAEGLIQTVQGIATCPNCGNFSFQIGKRQNQAIHLLVPYFTTDHEYETAFQTSVQMVAVKEDMGYDYACTIGTKLYLRLSRFRSGEKANLSGEVTVLRVTYRWIFVLGTLQETRIMGRFPANSNLQEGAELSAPGTALQGQVFFSKTTYLNQLERIG